MGTIFNLLSTNGARVFITLLGFALFYSFIHALILTIKGPEWKLRTSYEKVITIVGFFAGIPILFALLSELTR